MSNFDPSSLGFVKWQNCKIYLYLFLLIISCTNRLLKPFSEDQYIFNSGSLFIPIRRVTTIKFFKSYTEIFQDDNLAFCCYFLPKNIYVEKRINSYKTSSVKNNEK